VPRPWDDWGFKKRKQTHSVCRGLLKSLARKRMVRLAERNHYGADRHKKSLD